MPFLSLKQSKACFSTHGFNGKVNCKEFASHTNYKNLPDKKSVKLRVTKKPSK